MGYKRIKRIVQTSNDDGTQTSVADGTGYYYLVEDAIMEQVEEDNNKKAKQEDHVSQLLQNIWVLKQPQQPQFLSN